jgi:hypothetical protein
VSLHAPMWAATNLAENGWQEVEQLLNGRNYTRNA